METFVLMPQRYALLITIIQHLSILAIFDFLAELSTSLDSIRQISTGLNDMRNLQDVQEEG